MTKCYAYIRVSTVKQGDGASLEAQQEAIKRYALQNDITITRWYEEKQTAAKVGRPVFNEVIKNLRRGRAEGLVVHKVDRSTRNIREWARIGELADTGVQIHFATESLDFSSRGGRLAADIQAVVAADYIRNLREEAKKGLNMRLEQGLYPFKAPLGYLDTGRGKPKTICPTKGPLVRTMFELYASAEYSLWSLPDEMNRRGLTSSCGGKMYKTSVEKILKNPFYKGLICIQSTGKQYQGIHEPIVSHAMFEAVQKVRQKRDNQKSTRHNHLFRGMVRCAGCDKLLIGELQKGRVYYRCHEVSCEGSSIREDALDVQWRAMLESVVLRPQHVSALEQGIRDYIAEKRSVTGVDNAELEITKIATRLDKLLDHYLDGSIESEIFEEKKARLLDEKLRWVNIQTKNKEFGGTETFSTDFLKWSQEIPKLYDLAQKSEKRALLKLATSNCTLRGKNLELEPSNWLQALQIAGGVPEGADAKSKARTFVKAVQQSKLDHDCRWSGMIEQCLAFDRKKTPKIVDVNSTR